MKKLFLVLFWSSTTFSAPEYFPSGLFKGLEEEAPAARLSENAAVFRFLKRYFPQGSGFTWKRKSITSDATHAHQLFELYYGDRRVLDKFLKVHYNKNGWVQYASSTWDFIFATSAPTDTAVRMKAIEQQLKAEFIKKYRRFDGQLLIEPVFFAEDRVVPALDVIILSFNPGVYRRLIIDEKTGNVIQEKLVARNVSSKVYKVSPLATHPPLESVTLDPSPSDLPDPSKLANSFLRVRRDQNTATPTQVDVDASTDYSMEPDFLAYSAASTPENYNYTCTTRDATCSNQSFDSVNVFFHLNTYRKKIQTYFGMLGVTPTFPFDPLHVIVNGLSYDLDHDGSTIDEVNNAAYIPFACQPDMARCLIFFRPAINTLTCPGATFFDLSREANVVVHEYQHYVTDTITQMVPGTLALPLVGDALHEGYSDYLAASHISELSGLTITKIGEYAFQNCASLVRDVGLLRVLQNSQAEKDYHLPGLTWASGLWQLREEFGREVADLLAVKSLFFLSVKPGFVEAVEALVKADAALYGAVHAGRIRKLFYDELKFLGNQPNFFRDLEKGLAELGFQSCAGVSASRNFNPYFSILLFFVWLKTLLLLGRRCH